MEIGAVKASGPVQTISCPVSLPQPPGRVTELQLRCWAHPNPVWVATVYCKREGLGLLASESPPPLNYDPRSSPPINLAQERVALSSRGEKGGMESDCWSSTLDSTFINHVT